MSIMPNTPEVPVDAPARSTRKPHSHLPGYICERRGTYNGTKGHYAIFDGLQASLALPDKWALVFFPAGMSELTDVTMIDSFPSCNKARARMRHIFTPQGAQS